MQSLPPRQQSGQSLLNALIACRRTLRLRHEVLLHANKQKRSLVAAQPDRIVSRTAQCTSRNSTNYHAAIAVPEVHSGISPRAASEAAPRRPSPSCPSRVEQAAAYIHDEWMLNDLFRSERQVLVQSTTNNTPSGPFAKCDLGKTLPI